MHLDHRVGRLPPASRAAMCGLLLLGLPATAVAEPGCMARILSDVPALEAPEQVKSKQSGSFGPLTEIKVEKRSGKMFYCATNTHCYGSNAFQIVTPCRFKLDKEYGFGPYFIYSAR